MGFFQNLEISDCDDTRSLTLWAYLSATRFRIGCQLPLQRRAFFCAALLLGFVSRLLTRACGEPGIPARMPLEQGRSGPATEPNRPPDPIGLAVQRAGLGLDRAPFERGESMKSSCTVLATRG